MIYLRTGFVFLSLLFASGAGAENGPTTNSELPQKIYGKLGLEPGASVEKIEAAYKKLSVGDPEKNAGIAAAYALLSQPETKRQIDGGKTEVEVSVPEGEREKLALLLEKVDPQKASFLRRTGKVTAHSLNSAMLFYIALGLSEHAKCFVEKDPTACKSYAESMKDPVGHIGFALFMVAAKLGNIAGEKIHMNPRLASYFGLAAGALANEVFVEIYNHPNFKEYRKAASIKDPQERKKKRDEELQKMAEETYKNPDWYKDKAPTLAALIGGSVATEATMKLLHLALQKGASGKILPGNCSSMFASLDDLLSGAKGARLKGWKGYSARAGAEMAGVLVFLSHLAWLHDPVDEAWSSITLERELKNLREKFHSPAANLDEARLKEMLGLGEKLWEKRRRKEMAGPEKIMAAHQQNLHNFEKAVQRPFLFYSWFLTGFKEDFEWESLRKAYYEGDTKPQDIEKDTNKYLRSFFCGGESGKSIRDEQDIHGIPNPFHFNVKVDAYRVVGEVDPALCAKNASPAQYRALLKSKDFSEQFKAAHLDQKLSAAQIKQNKLDRYGNRIDGELINALEKHILPSYKEELDDLQKLRDSLQKNPRANRLLIDLVSGQIVHTERKRDSANKLAIYMKAPVDERVAPASSFFDGLFEDRENIPTWQKVVQYYNGFILQ